MKVSEIEIYNIRLPYAKELVAGWGRAAYSDNLFVKIYTDDGHEGIGEICGGVSTGLTVTYMGEVSGGILAALDIISPLVIGENPYSIGRIHQKMSGKGGTGMLHNGGAKLGIDMALHDLVSRAQGIPLYDFLGGKYRDSFYVQHLLGLDTPEGSAKTAVELMEEGYRVFEVKSGLNPDDDAVRMNAIADAVGDDVLLISDPNANWSAVDTIRVIRKMEKHPNIICEGPVRNLEELAKVRRKVNMPIVADDDVFTSRDALKVLELDAADMINIKLQKCGGFYEALRIIAICDAVDMPYRIDDMGVSKIGNTAAAHLAVSGKNIIACGGAQHTYFSDDIHNIIKSGGLRIRTRTGFCS